MTRFPSPLATATLLLLSVAARTTEANTDFLVETDGELAVNISTTRQGNSAAATCEYCVSSGVALSSTTVSHKVIS